MNSPYKTNLLELDVQRSNKKVVGCEINGWMQTHIKTVISSIPPPSKFIRKMRIISSPTQKTSISRLKENKINLLKSTIRKFSQKTPLTADSDIKHIKNNGSSSQFKSYRSSSYKRSTLAPLRVAEISQFNAQQQILSFHPSNLNQNKKTSLLRLRALSKKGVKQSANPLLFGKQADILQSKITQNQYRGLKFITRRLTAKLSKQ